MHKAGKDLKDIGGFVLDWIGSYMHPQSPTGCDARYCPITDVKPKDNAVVVDLVELGNLVSGAARYYCSRGMAPAYQGDNYLYRDFMALFDVIDTPAKASFYMFSEIAECQYLHSPEDVAKLFLQWLQEHSVEDETDE